MRSIPERSGVDGAYGETRYTWGTTPTDYRFTGQRQDSYIKLVKMGARWYDSELGRWISPDTTVPEPENPQAFNRYSYVEGNPCRYVDMTGHWKFDVHHTRTQKWVHEIEMKVYAYRNTPLDVMPDNLYDTIADANNDVDVDAIRNLVIHGGRKWGQTPNSSLGGAAPEQYYHYASKADAEARLMEAIGAKDATAFGKALHSYQDYYAHTLTGFTALPGDVGSLFSNCSECLYGESLLTLMERAEGLGHDGVSWPDKFDLSDQRAIDMMNGTKWYTLLFLLNYYDIDLEQFLADTGLDGSGWTDGE